MNIRLLDDPYEDGHDSWQFTPGTTVSIGRSSRSDIQLKETDVSRTHATVSHNGAEWECDSVGVNGVFCEEQLITKIAVTDGLVLRFTKDGPRLHFQLVVAGSLDETDPDQPAVDWIAGLAEGDGDAANQLWQGYFERVVKLAKSRISGRQGRITDGEDVAVSVFQSICAGMQAGRFPDLKSQDSLWRLLCVMTKRKVAKHVKHERRLKRGGGQVRGESVFIDNAATDSLSFGLEQFGGSGDEDNFGVELAEQAEWLFEILGDDELRKITELRLAEHTNDEIAELLGCHVRTVKRRLQTIRSILGSAMNSDD